MPESNTIADLHNIVARTGIHYSALGAACGISASTARFVLATGRLPARAQAREALERFAVRNADAAERRVLRFA